MDLRPWYRRYLGWLLAGLVLLVLVLRFGGPTLVLLNSSGQPVCGVYIAHTDDVEQRGPNRISVEIEYPHSRDVRLPLTFDWFRPDGAESRHVWAYGCGENLLAEMDWPLDEGTTILQVER